jgi:hypothetical protein
VALARVPDLHIVAIFLGERGLKPRDYMPVRLVRPNSCEMRVSCKFHAAVQSLILQ